MHVLLTYATDIELVVNGIVTYLLIRTLRENRRRRMQIIATLREAREQVERADKYRRAARTLLGIARSLPPEEAADESPTPARWN